MNIIFSGILSNHPFLKLEFLFTFDGIITLTAGLSVMAVFTAIALDFILFDKRQDFKRKKKSSVATGTMVLFFWVYYIVIFLKIGQVPRDNILFWQTLAILGALMVAAGAALNIWGRFQLKQNWSNHIKIYKDQTLVTSGAFRIVRHPLYASLMLMLLGGSLIYLNYLSAFLTLAVFIPFMTHRARQEEILLQEQFNNYSEYKAKTGMFFPKFGRR